MEKYVGLITVVTSTKKINLYAKGEIFLECEGVDHVWKEVSNPSLAVIPVIIELLEEGETFTVEPCIWSVP